MPQHDIVRSVTRIQDTDDLAVLVRGKELIVDGNLAASVASTGRYKTIGAAMTAATAGTTLRIYPGTYAEDITFGADGVKMIGVGYAGYNITGPSFASGVSITGSIDINNKKHCAIDSMTINVSGAVKDGIGSGASYALSSVDLYADLRNLVIVGAGPLTATHGIRMESGSSNTIHNVRIYSCGHGIALRCAMTNVSDVHIENCGISGIIVKSTTVNGDAYGNNIVNAVFKGGAGPITEGYDTGTYARNTNWVNCYCHDMTISSFIARTVSGFVLNVNFTNCQSYVTASVGFDIAQGDRITLTNCMSNVSLVGFKNTAATNVKLIACDSAAASITAIQGTFETVASNGVTSIAALSATSATIDGTFKIRQPGNTRYYAEVSASGGSTYDISYDLTGSVYIPKIYQGDSFLFTKPFVGDMFSISTIAALLSVPLTINGGLRTRQTGATRYRSDYGVASGAANLNAYDDTGAVYIPLTIDASTISLQPSGNASLALVVDASGNVSVGGRMGGAWATLPYTTGATVWADLGGGYQAAQYKKVGDLVFIRGTATRSSGSGTIIATLPAGFRPASIQLYSTITDAGAGRIDIATDGTMTAFGGTGYVSLNFTFSTI